MENVTFIVGNPEEDFFQQNPQVRYFPEVQRLLGTVAEDVAGKIMWAIYLTEDPDSKYYPITYEERRKIIAENYLKQDDFDWGKYDFLVEAYPIMCLGITERWYKSLSDKFGDLVAAVTKMDVIDEYKELILMYDKVEKMVKGLEAVKSLMQKEKAKRVEVRGSSQPGFFGKS